MTVTIKQEKINGYYICIEQEKYSDCYNVVAYRMFKDGTCGYPIKDNLYIEERQAKRRFNDLKRKANNNDL